MQDSCKWLFRVNFFPYKSAWIFACAFELSSKRFPCICLAGLHFASEKNDVKYQSVHNECNKAEQEYFSRKKDTGECFSTKLKSTYKNSGTFEGKIILPKDVTYVPLAPSHLILKLLFLVFLSWDCLHVKSLFFCLRVWKPFHAPFNFQKHFTFTTWIELKWKIIMNRHNLHLIHVCQCFFPYRLITGLS